MLIDDNLINGHMEDSINMSQQSYGRASVVDLLLEYFDIAGNFVAHYYVPKKSIKSLYFCYIYCCNNTVAGDDVIIIKNFASI